MDQSFDDLARSFGTTMSRRRALKLMVVAAFGTALGLRARPASAAHCATERTCKNINGTMTCVRPFGGDTNPSQDCKCAPDAKEGDGCIQAREHCGSSDNPCPPDEKKPPAQGGQPPPPQGGQPPPEKKP